MTFRNLMAAFLCLIAVPAFAHDYTVGALHVVHPWSRATPKGAAVAGGYMTITNKGTEPDRLVGGASPAAGRFEIHEMRMTEGVMQMRPLPQGLEIKPGETVELRPGSFHIMLVGLKEPLKQGTRVPGTLTFERAGQVAIEYHVEALGGKPAHGPGGHDGHGHHGH